METNVYEFLVDNEHSITPPADYIVVDCTYQSVEIIGSCTSLIAINEVASFFDYHKDAQYDWNLTETKYVKPNVLIAIVWTRIY